MTVSIVVNEHESRLTILDGSGGQRDFRTADEALVFALLHFPDVDEAIFGPGSFHFRHGVVVDRPFRIRLRTGTVLLPSDEPIGLLEFTADDCTFEGPGIVQCDKYYPHQRIVEFSGHRAIVRDLCFDVSTDKGQADRPMILVRLFGGSSRRVENNTFLPNSGVTCISATRGKALTISGNRFTNGTTTEVTSPVHEQRNCYRCIDLEHEGWTQVHGNRAEGLGYPSSSPVDAFLHYQYDHRLHVVNPEAGHLQVVGNYIEDLSASTYIRLRGCAWFQIVANTFANSLATSLQIGDGGIVVDSELGDGKGRLSNDGHIASNQLHNLGRPNSKGVFLYIRACFRLAVLSNQFATVMCENAIRVHPQKAVYLTISGNSFEGILSAALAIAPRSAIYTEPATHARMVIGGNTVSSFYAKPGDTPLLAKGGPLPGFVFENGLVDRKTGQPPTDTTKISDLSTNVWHE